MRSDVTAASTGRDAFGTLRQQSAIVVCARAANTDARSVLYRMRRFRYCCLFAVLRIRLLFFLFSFSAWYSSFDDKGRNFGYS